MYTDSTNTSRLASRLNCGMEAHLCMSAKPPAVPRSLPHECRLEREICERHDLRSSADRFITGSTRGATGLQAANRQPAPRRAVFHTSLGRLVRRLEYMLVCTRMRSGSVPSTSSSTWSVYTQTPPTVAPCHRA